MVLTTRRARLMVLLAGRLVVYREIVVVVVLDNGLER